MCTLGSEPKSTSQIQILLFQPRCIVSTSLYCFNLVITVFYFPGTLNRRRRPRWGTPDLRSHSLATRLSLPTLCQTSLGPRPWARLVLDPPGCTSLRLLLSPLFPRSFTALSPLLSFTSLSPLLSFTSLSPLFHLSSLSPLFHRLFTHTARLLLPLAFP